MKKIVFVLITTAVILFSSCSKGNYLTVIPEDATALISVDAQNSGLKIDAEGIDTKEKIYLFETTDGSLCLAAKCTLSGDGFKVFQDKWVCGYGDGKMLIMGPVLAAQQDEAKQRIKRLLEQEEEESIVGTPMLERLDSISSPIALVAQSSAIPEQFAALFTLGAPRNAKPSQICVAAKIALKDGVMQIEGTNFSLNKSINQALQESKKAFRPLKGVYSKEATNQFFSLLMNVEGGQLLPILQQNEGLQALLTGINTAIDMDNILRSVDGDMAIMVDGTLLNMQIKAQLQKRDFLKDVDYWKSSCPSGTRITNQGKDTWQFEGADANFLFGVTADNQFFGKLTRKQKTDSSQFVSAALDMLKPFVGELKSIVYTVGQ